MLILYVWWHLHAFLLWVWSFVFDEGRTCGKHQLPKPKSTYRFSYFASLLPSFLSFPHDAFSTFFFYLLLLNWWFYLPNACLPPQSSRSLCFITSLFTISSILVSPPPPPSLARSSFSQLMEEFGLQKIVSTSHLQNTQMHGGNCKSAAAVTIIGCQPTHPSKHT